MEYNEFEGAVLGAVLLESDAYDRVSDVLTHDMFTTQENKAIWVAISELKAKGQVVDLLTTRSKMKELYPGIAIAGYLADLTSKVASSSNIEAHASYIQRKYAYGQIEATCISTIEKAKQAKADVDAMITEAHASLDSIKTPNSLAKVTSFGSDIAGYMKALEDIQRKHTNGIVGIPSMFPSLDDATGGFGEQDLVIIAARPSMGKTSFALHIAANAALNGHPGAVFSLEMSDTQLKHKIVSMYTGIDSSDIRRGRLSNDDWKRMHAKIATLEKLQLYIVDKPAITPQQVRVATKRMIRENGIKWIVVDYLQLMSPGVAKQSREQEIAYISGQLKQIAKECNIPVIALSQLSRGVEMRARKMPILSDLRDSGSIEQDADMILFLYRPWYYKYEYCKQNYPDIPQHVLEMLTFVDLAKNRNGALITTPLEYNRSTNMFEQSSDPSVLQFCGLWDATAVATYPRQSNVQPRLPYSDKELEVDF